MSRKNIKYLSITVIVFVLLLFVSVIPSVRHIDLQEGRIYELSVMSSDADDVDINLIVGYGVSVEGITDAYLIDDNGSIYFADDKDISLVNDVDAIDEELYVGEDILTMLDSVMNNQVIFTKSDSLEILNGIRCYEFTIDVKDNVYGIYRMHSYITESGELYRVVALTSDGITITATVSSSDNYSVESDTVNEISYGTIKDTIADSFIKNNIYTCGKYTLVDIIIDAYNKWLGGKL